jgi:hypothetical protein
VDREDLIFLTSDGLISRRGGASAVDARQYGAVPSANAIHLAIAVNPPGGTTTSLYVDGTSTPITATGASPARGIDTITLGARKASGSISIPMDGYIYRTLHYAEALNATQLEQVAAWAASTYGTPNLA